MGSHKKKAVPQAEPESESNSDTSEDEEMEKEDIVEDKSDVEDSDSEDEVEQPQEDEEEKKKVVRPDESNKTIFVGNLPVNTKKEQVKTFFKSFGPVKTVRLRSHTGKKIYNRSTVQKDAFITAFVVLESEQMAEKAVESCPKTFRDRRIRVTLAAQKKGANKKTIFVGNLPYATVDDDLYQVFSTCGEVESIRTIRGPNGCTGIAYVSFKEKNSLILALQLQGTMIRDRPIRLEKCKDMQKAERKEGKKEETKMVHKFVNGKHIKQKAAPTNADNALKRLKKKPGFDANAAGQKNTMGRNNNPRQGGGGGGRFGGGGAGRGGKPPGHQRSDQQGGPSKGGAKRTNFKPTTKKPKNKGMPKNIQLAKRLNVNWKKPTYKAGPKKSTMQSSSK